MVDGPVNARAHPLVAWRDRGRVIDVFGLRVFVLESGEDTGGVKAAAPLLVLHGFPTSSHDFAYVLSRLNHDRLVVLFDFPGFGLSGKPPEYSYSLLEQAEVAIEVWRRLGISQGHLLAHDYGTSVATELLARSQRGLLPIELRSLTLCNGSVHIELAELTLAQRLLRDRRVGPVFARLAGERLFKSRMRALFSDPDRLDERMLSAMWEGVTCGGGRDRLSDVSSYLDERHRFWSRWIGALRQTDLPVHVVWGREDPVAVAAIAETLHDEIPGSELTWLDGVGHYPMVESPARFVDAVVGFIARHDAKTRPAKSAG